MIKIKIDMTGWVMSEHGVPESKLTVIERADDYIDSKGRRYAQWLCECGCKEHNRIIVLGNNIRQGRTLSCGCLYKGINKKENSFDLSNEYGIGYTVKGEEFWFDKEDYDIVRQYCWYYNDYGYVMAYDPETTRKIRLHRLVMGVEGTDMDVNHKKHLPRTEPKFDNRKSNLEIVTRSQNNMNASLSINNTSGITGVSWDNAHQKWRAKITVNYKRIELGMFENKADAINARKQAEVIYFGEYRYDVNN